MVGTVACNLFKEWWKTQNEDAPYSITPQHFGVKINLLNIDGIEKGKHTSKGETKI